MVAPRCFMFMCFLLPHWVPATWRSRAQTNIRAELPSGKKFPPPTSVLLEQDRGQVFCFVTICSLFEIHFSRHSGMLTPNI